MQQFDQQVQTLVDLGYPALAELDEPAFRQLLEPLRAQARTCAEPWVIVIAPPLVSPELLVPLLHLRGSAKPGVVDRNHGAEGLTPYRPLDVLEVPDADAYLLEGVERGEEFCNVRPQDALPVITGRGRTPLTISEGVALVTHHPELLEKNRCFMLSGSRRGDRRVPAMWISAGAPKLGWCWDGNPHTWLGTASASGRLVARPTAAPVAP